MRVIGIHSRDKEKVDQILAVKKVSNGEGDAADLERRIDTLVYRLYNLTQEEIQIVERK